LQISLDGKYTVKTQDKFHSRKISKKKITTSSIDPT
jgi:hypothetical protein